MIYKPFKFVVTAVALKVDGEVFTEVEANPVTIYGIQALVEWAQAFEENLAAATVREMAEMDGRAP
jgi:hypothetical protein